MCGFVGFIYKKNILSYENNISILNSMAQSIKYRGPDDTNNWVNIDKTIFCSHNRLSIQDLSINGKQPMISENKRWVLLFNGEIYNHNYLRGRYFKNKIWNGNCDTETLLFSIQELGLIRTLEIISGMYSFILIDQFNNKIKMIRDRIGEKPLYYGIHNETLFFCSEVKALKKHPNFINEIDKNSLSEYMKFGYIPSPSSIYKKIKKVPSATIIEFDYKNFEKENILYWNIDTNFFNKFNNNKDFKENEIINNTKNLLQKSVSEKLISDVPLGCFLSGGIDSSLISAITQEVSNKPIDTFNVGLENINFDESKNATKIAKILKTNHNTLMLDSKAAMEVIPKISDIYCEPFADSSQIPTFLISKFSSERVTVVLSGDGGDELFGGYNRYFFTKNIWNKIRYLSPEIRKIIAKIILLPSSKSYDLIYSKFINLFNKKSLNFTFGEQLHKLANAIKIKNENHLYNYFISYWEDPSNIINNNIYENSLEINSSSKLNNLSLTDKMIFQDLKGYLPDDILCKVDRASMSVSLETRLPYLDKNVIDYALSIPTNKKIDNKNSKIILKKILENYLPKDLIYQKKKGFSIPLNDWLRTTLKEWCLDIANSSQIKKSGLINISNFNKIVNDHMNHHANHGNKIWAVLMFHQWYDK